MSQRRLIHRSSLWRVPVTNRYQTHDARVKLVADYWPRIRNSARSSRVLLESEQQGNRHRESDDDDNAADAFRADAAGDARAEDAAHDRAHGHHERVRPRDHPVPNEIHGRDAVDAQRE